MFYGHAHLWSVLMLNYIISIIITQCKKLMGVALDLLMIIYERITSDIFKKLNPFQFTIKLTSSHPLHPPPQTTPQFHGSIHFIYLFFVCVFRSMYMLLYSNSILKEIKTFLYSLLKTCLTLVISLTCTYSPFTLMSCKYLEVIRFKTSFDNETKRKMF